MSMERRALLPSLHGFVLFKLFLHVRLQGKIATILLALCPLKTRLNICSNRTKIRYKSTQFGLFFLYNLDTFIGYKITQNFEINTFLYKTFKVSSVNLNILSDRIIRKETDSIKNFLEKEQVSIQI